MNPAPPPCWACGRVVALRTKIQRRVGGGKHRVSHKCPHGRSCVAGHPLMGQQGMNYSTCPDCRKEKPETFSIVMDVKQRRPACVLLQAAMGGNSPAMQRFFGHSGAWVLAPTSDMHMVTGTAEQWQRCAAEPQNNPAR